MKGGSCLSSPQPQRFYGQGGKYSAVRGGHYGLSGGVWDPSDIPASGIPQHERLRGWRGLFHPTSQRGQGWLKGSHLVLFLLLLFRSPNVQNMEGDPRLACRACSAVLRRPASSRRRRA